MGYPWSIRHLYCQAPWFKGAKGCLIYHALEQTMVTLWRLSHYTSIRGPARRSMELTRFYHLAVIRHWGNVCTRQHTQTCSRALSPSAALHHGAHMKMHTLVKPHRKGHKRIDTYTTKLVHKYRCTNTHTYLPTFTCAHAPTNTYICHFSFCTTLGWF